MKIGFLGTGLMGEPMAEKLLQAGLEVVAYNRTKSKLEPLKKSGAEIANSPEDAIATADCLILMLTNAEAIEQVLLSDESLPHLSGCTVIQMSTIAPSESREIEKAVNAAGGDYLEAPVLGSIPQVKSGELQVMVGATPELFNKWSDLLKNFGPEPILIGEVGSASALKLALNQLIASLTSAFALSLGFIQRQGVDVEKFMDILRESALYAPTFDKKLKRMVEGNYANPNFPSKHLLKDTDLFLKEAQLVEQNVSSLEGVRKVIDMALQLGLADQDYSALFAAVNPKQD
ncbi:MAG: NAD(P)-dependent oxidoreductase [Coleofasciculaceae cyanobacterium]